MSRHPLAKWLNRWTRRLHRWGAAAAALPVAVIIATGLLLQLKRQSDWIQPPTARGVGAGAAEGTAGGPNVTFDRILQAAMDVQEADIRGWEDVDRLDVRPGHGVVKVRAANRWEVQVDTHTGQVVQVAYRRSDLIESIHDGSFFGGSVSRFWVFLPAAAVLGGLWGTGMYLWALPIWVRRRSRRIEADP